MRQCIFETRSRPSRSSPPRSIRRRVMP